MLLRAHPGPVVTVLWCGWPDGPPGPRAVEVCLSCQTGGLSSLGVPGVNEMGRGVTGLWFRVRATPPGGCGQVGEGLGPRPASLALPWGAPASALLHGERGLSRRAWGRHAEQRRQPVPGVSTGCVGHPRPAPACPSRRLRRARLPGCRAVPAPALAGRGSQASARSHLGPFPRLLGGVGDSGANGVQRSPGRPAAAWTCVPCPRPTPSQPAGLSLQPWWSGPRHLPRPVRCVSASRAPDSLHPPGLRLAQAPLPVPGLSWAAVSAPRSAAFCGGQLSVPSLTSLRPSTQPHSARRARWPWEGPARSRGGEGRRRHGACAGPCGSPGASTGS